MRSFILLLILFSYGCLNNITTNITTNQTLNNLSNITNTINYSSYSVKEAMDSGRSLICEANTTNKTIKIYFKDKNLYQISKQNGAVIKLALINDSLYLSGVPGFSCNWVMFHKTGENKYGPVSIDFSDTLKNFDCYEGSVDLSDFSFNDVCVYNK